MAEKLGFFDQWMWGNWAERGTINKNAETLGAVEASVGSLQATVANQAQEIIRLRAMLAGLVEVLRSTVQLDDAALEIAANAAWAKLVPQPPENKPAATDPYRGLPASGDDPTPDEIAAAKQLLRVAEDHHFSKRFANAIEVYQEIIDRYCTTKQAATARQQIANLRGK